MSYSITQTRFRTSVFLLMVGIFSLLFITLTPRLAYGADVFSKNEQPFGVPYDVWAGKFWSWAVSLSKADVLKETKSDGTGCIKNEINSMVMLRPSSAEGEPKFSCNISRHSGIMVSLWSGFYEKNNKTTATAQVDQLSNLAKSETNQGRVVAWAIVDGDKVAEIDETTTGTTTSYNIMKNVIEIYAKKFNITIPADTNAAPQVTGTWQSGAQGWWSILKPLTPGDHTIVYYVDVSGSGPNHTSAKIAYKLHVE